MILITPGLVGDEAAYRVGLRCQRFASSLIVHDAGSSKARQAASVSKLVVALSLASSPHPYNPRLGGCSLSASSALSVRITYSTCASNFCAFCSKPVKSAASRDNTGLAFPLSRYPSRFSGIIASTFRSRSLANARSISARQRVPRAAQLPNPAVHLFVGSIRFSSSQHRTPRPCSASCSRRANSLSSWA